MKVENKVQFGKDDKMVQEFEGPWQTHSTCVCDENCQSRTIIIFYKSATDPSIISLSEEGVTHRNVGDYHCHLSRHPFVSQIKYIVQHEGALQKVVGQT